MPAGCRLGDMLSTVSVFQQAPSLDPRPARERFRLRADVAALFERPADLIGGLLGIVRQGRRAHREKPVAAHGLLRWLRAALVSSAAARQMEISPRLSRPWRFGHAFARQHVHQAAAVEQLSLERVRQLFVCLPARSPPAGVRRGCIARPA